MGVAGFDFDLTDLLTEFSELLPLTNEDLGQYWFRYNRADGLSVTLSMSIYDRCVGIILRSGELTLATFQLSGCDYVKVVRQKQGETIEIGGSHKNPDARCVLVLDGGWIVRFTDTQSD